MKKILCHFIEYLIVLIFCFVFLIWILNIRLDSIFMSYTYAGDGLGYGVLFKGILENGWFLENPSIGMPTGYHMYDYPQAEAVNFILIKSLSILSSDYVVVTNLFIILGYFLAAITSFFVFRHFQISFGPAIVGSLLFAFSPYHIMRAGGHILLGIYFMIPLAVMVVIWIFFSKDLLISYNDFKQKISFNLKSEKFWGAALICLLVSSSGIYYALFTCFFLVVAGVSSLGLRRGYNLLNALILVGIIISGIMANAAPNLIYQFTHDTKSVQRLPQEPELYGLKITQLLLPAHYHRIPQLAQFTNHYNSTAPLVNENTTASLGIVGSIGFLLLISWILFYRNVNLHEIVGHLSVLNLSAVLLATIGGFASLFTYLTHFQLRGYNRISIFIAFFSLLAIAFIFDKWREHWGNNQLRRIMIAFLLGIVMIGGMFDQTLTPSSISPYKVQYLQDEHFIKTIESIVPAGTMIFQLPYIPFPEHPPVNKLNDYEHFKGYLHSTHLRWSYGAPRGGEGDLWQQQVASKPPAEFVKTITLAGFGGLWLDRFGYVDNGIQLVTQLNAILQNKPLESEDKRYVFWDLTSYATHLENRPSEEEQKQEAVKLRLLTQVSVEWGTGFYDEERDTNNHWRWSKSVSSMRLSNRANESIKIKLTMRFVTPGDSSAIIQITGDLFKDELITQNNAYVYTKELDLPPGVHEVHFSTQAKRLITADPREIYFGIYNYQWQIVP